MDMGVADDVEIAKALARQLKIPMIRLNAGVVNPDAVALVPAEIAESYSLMPIRIQEGKLVVAMVNPLEFYAVDDLRFITGMPVYIAVAAQNEILAALHQFYPKAHLEESMSRSDDPASDIEVLSSFSVDEKTDGELLKLTQLPPVVRFVNAILSEAIQVGASDVHIEPRKESVLVRYRIDGIMREMMKTDKHVHASLVSRIKVLSGMDISIRRKPQDGRAKVRFSGVDYDLRTSSMPTSYGEKITLRILNPNRVQVGIENLGLSETDRLHLLGAISSPQGMMLVTGPTGSGKSSSLYACLNRLNTPEVNIITVEDPVEFDIEGINQVQINPKAGITFAAGLRSMLRQDPDIVMVGEIRDSETAQIAFQAAQTGHLVLSTLHTNDAPSAIVRLMDLGVDHFIIASALTAVVGQRLVRAICPHCKVPESIAEPMLRQIFPYIALRSGAIFWKGAGCESCQYTGYKGRIGIFELLRLVPEILPLIEPKVSSAALKEAAVAHGYKTLTEDGLAKAASGLTSVEEVFRVAPPAMVSDDLPEARPAFSDTDPRAPVLSPPPVTSAQPRRALVVDDSEIVVKVVKNILESDNFVVETAADGLSAFKQAIQGVPDLIVTDYLMPNMDGLGLIGKLREHSKTRYIPIIMLTAKDEVDAEARGIQAGADDYITKPVNPVLLLARANRLLQRSQSAA